MNAGNLDAKIVKALKKQEEKREKRVTRKKEVCFINLSVELVHSVPSYKERYKILTSLVP